MRLLPFLYPTLLTLFTFTPLSDAKSKNAILLSKVKSLTLRDNAKTSHRRVPAVPQLTCTGPGCRYYKVDVMRCTNQGSDYSSEDIQWSCTANLPEEFKLGSTDVICEGYDSKDDDYILKGSCAVEYRLLLTDVGEKKYGKSYWDGGSRDVEKGVGLLFWLIFFGVVFWILYSMWQGYQQGPNAPPRRPFGGWGGGWGGGGGPDDPYDPPPPYPGTGKRYTRNYGAADQAWRPGFWSGAAAGAAGGYFAGSRAANRQQNQGGNSWGSGWGGAGGSGWGPSSNAGSSSSHSGPSNSRSSTGFGSTSRR